MRRRALGPLVVVLAGQAALSLLRQKGRRLLTMLAIAIAIGSVAGASLVGMAVGWSLSIPLQAVVVARLVSTTVGVFFGFLPARRAARLDPIEALRAE